MPDRLTLQEFITKSISIHGDRYSYACSEYKSIKSKICVICKKHGKFWQTPSEHFKGSGCRKCSIEDNHNKTRSTKKEFILKARKIHGDLYNYDNVLYKTNHDPVEISCKIHGKFYKRPNTHLSGQGCPKCGWERIAKSHVLTTEDFIQKSRKLFPDYDYSKTQYVRSKLPVIPNNVLNGSGCPMCARENLGKAVLLTQGEFLRRSLKIHKGFYDYSKAVYIRNSKKVEILCPNHGYFWQIPANHMKGAGCPVCKKEKMSKLRRFSLEKYLDKFHKVHGNTYDYSRVVYTGPSQKQKIEIICSKHGSFLQTAQMHAAGNGCPSCCRSRAEERIREWLTEKGIQFKTQYKFPDCKNKKQLCFDFYIPKNLCIEYDGELHYKTFKKTSSGTKKLEWTQRNDAIKNDYCHKNGIRLLRIPYWEQANIEKILTEEIL